MKLVLKDKKEITVNAVNNSMRLNGADKGHSAPTVTFRILEAGADVTMDGIVEMVKGENTTGFVLSYGAGQESAYPGWEISDVAEEIYEDRRIISIIATRVEAEA